MNYLWLLKCLFITNIGSGFDLGLNLVSEFPAKKCIFFFLFNDFIVIFLGVVIMKGIKKQKKTGVFFNLNLLN